MPRNATGISLILIISIGAGIAATPTIGAADDSFRQAQLNRLFQPRSSQLSAEARGQVYIYDGLTDRDITRAMDQQFGRIEHMMFVRTVVTNEQGKPETESSGEPVVEDDGC
jgi:ABC-type lipoprotein release transport system permease subunit